LGLQNYHDAQKQFPAGYTSGFDTSGNDTGPGWGWAAYLLPYMEQDNLYRQMTLTLPIEHSANASVRVQIVKPFLCPADAVPQSVAVGPRAANGQLASTTCTLAPANYVGNYGTGEPGVDGDGIFFRNSTVRIGDITDGTSSTLIVGERSFRYSEATWVGAVTGANQGATPNSPLPVLPENASNFILAHTGEMWDGPSRPYEMNHFSSPHTRGVNFVFADGHVRFLSGSTDYTTFKALSTRKSGETISGDH
jgi:prepilin-type processing-associated H-X9-DG protein